MNLLVVTARSPFGPKEAFLLPELRELEARGCRVTLVPLRYGGQVTHPTAERYAADAVVLDPRHRPFRREVRHGIARLRRRRKVPDGAPFFALVLGAIMADVARSREIDHIHAVWASTPAAAAAVASALTGIPWSFTAHRYDIFEQPAGASLLATASFGRFISEDGLGAARARWPRLPDEVAVVHIGIDLPAPAPWPRQPNVLCAAAMISRKDHATLIRGFSQVKTLGALLMAGDGPLRPRLETQAASKPAADRIRFLGRLPHHDLLELLDSSQMSIAVQTSRHEGISVSLMEALGRSVPVVATDVGGTSELVGDQAGSLIPVQDPDELAAALQRLLDAPERMRELGRRGRDRIVQDFDARQTAAQMFDLLASVD